MIEEGPLDSDKTNRSGRGRAGLAPGSLVVLMSVALTAAPTQAADRLKAEL